MEHEGMVHALEEIQRLLKPDGCLIDIHPVPEAPLIEVHQGAEILFAEPSPDHDAKDEHHAEDALARIAERRLFVIESSGEFDFLIYGSSVAELRDYREKTEAYDTRSVDDATAARGADQYDRVEKIMKSGGRGSEIAYHERGRIARLTPLRE
jgi:SAM-dependent methyltransferase